MTIPTNTLTKPPVSNDLAQVLPSFTTLTVAGKDIAIRQFKVGRLPLVLRTLQPISHMLMNREPGQSIDFGSLFMLYADDSLSLLAALADQSRAWVDELELDEAITLFTALLEVNTDFFIQKVLPQLSGAVQALTNKANHLAGQSRLTPGPTVSNP